MIKIIENLNLKEDMSKDNENKKYIKHATSSIIDDMKIYQKEVEKAEGKPLSDLKFLIQNIFKQLSDFKYKKESIKLNEGTIIDEKWSLIEKIQDEIYGENYEAMLISLVKFLPLDTIKEYFNSIMRDYDIHMDEELDEATSGIGAGNYATKAIDIIPDDIRKSKVN